MADDRIGRLFGMELETFGDTYPNALGFEELGDLGVVREVRARGVTPRIASPSVLLAKEAREGRSVLIVEAEFLADPLVPQLRERLGHFDA